MTGRSEAEVAARAVVALITGGLIPSNPRAIAKASEVLGVPIAAIRVAWQQWDVDPWSPPASTPVTTASPAQVERERNLERHRVSSWQARSPSPGRRRCASCGELKPSAEFPVKDQATQRLRSDCRPCWLERQRSRYLSVQHEAALAAVRIEFTLADGDVAVGLRCTICGESLEVGQAVVGVAALVHAHHGTIEAAPTPGVLRSAAMSDTDDDQTSTDTGDSTADETTATAGDSGDDSGTEGGDVSGGDTTGG